MRKSFISIFFCLSLLKVEAEELAIIGGNIYPVTREVIKKGVIVIKDGIITAVGRDLDIPSSARRIRAQGKVITPGFIDIYTFLGVVEVWKERETVDIDPKRLDPIRAAFVVTDSFNPNSALIPITRAEGVTSSLVVPQGGFISGLSGWVDLGKGSLCQVVNSRLAMHVNFGVSGAQKLGNGDGGARGEVILRFQELLEDVRFYEKNRKKYAEGRLRKVLASRLDLEALIPAVKAEIPFIIKVNRASDILAVLKIGQKEGVRVIIAGGAEAWMIAEKLAEAKVPVILNPLWNLPFSFESLGARSDNVAILEKAGVEIVISSFSAHNVGSLRHIAGNAVRAGMSWNEALKAITINPARVLGMDKMYGSIEVGKKANLVIWSGDPFEFSSYVEHVFVQGREVSLVTRQTKLFQRYKK